MIEETAPIATIPDRPMSGPVKLWRLFRRHPRVSALLALSLLSLVGLIAMFVTSNRQLGVELLQNERMNDRLRMTLTKQLADRIDGDLCQLALVPQTMAATLSVREDWTHEQIAPWVKEMLYKDERLFGTCVVFEPFQFDGRGEDYSHYVYWGPPNLRRHEPYTMAIDYPFRDEPWYSRPKIEEQGVWTEPYFDHAGNIFMITYSVPIYRPRRFLGFKIGEHRFAGVTTADLDLGSFDPFRKLDKLNLEKPGYGFVLSPIGKFISHPNPEYTFPKKITDIGAYQDGTTMKNLSERLLRHDTGSAPVAVDPWTGKRSMYYFAPIPSAQWTLVVVVEE